MKKRNLNKKLRVSRETLRRLGDGPLSAVRGGDSEFCPTTVCETWEDICHLLTLAPNCALPPWG